MILIWSQTFHIMHSLIRRAGDLPATGTEEESNGEQRRPPWVSKALRTVRFYRQGLQILWLNVIFVHQQTPGFWERLKRGCLGFLPACFKLKKPAEDEEVKIRLPKSLLMILLCPGNLLQSNLFEQNKEVLQLDLPCLLQVVAKKRDWAKSTHHHPSNLPAFSHRSRWCRHRRQLALWHEVLHWQS